MIQFFFENATFDTSILDNVDSWLYRVVNEEHSSILQLNFIFCSDDYLLGINTEYLSHEYFTDIITFDQRDEPNSPIEGDIFISADRVRENALFFNIPFHQELLRVMVHGILHLLGYDDHTDELKKIMRCLEDKYLDLHSGYAQP